MCASQFFKIFQITFSIVLRISQAYFMNACQALLSSDSVCTAVSRDSVLLSVKLQQFSISIR